jgi:ABC-type uncharacterized transport system permease subunit
MILSGALPASSPGLVVAWIGGAASLAYAVSAWLSTRERGGQGALAVAWLLHGAALLADVMHDAIVGGGVRFGFAPVLSVTMWLVLAVYTLENRNAPVNVVQRGIAFAALLTLLLMLYFPGTPHPAAASPWSPLHWVLGVASYALFGAAVVHGLMLDASERRLRLRVPGAAAPPPAGVLGMPLLKLERLTFRLVDAGFVVLTLALLLGFGELQAWRWDHKTVFSMLGWATFLALIVGRRRQGWRGRQATRWLYGGALLLMLAYVGSRFVLEVLLTRGTT